MIGKKVCFFQTIESTNTYVKEHLDTYKHGDIVCARMQTNGKGRRNNSWVSTDGNLHATVVLEKDLVTYQPFDVVMRTSNAVVETLKHYGIDAAIKYPNDIVVNGSKIAGILIENTPTAYIVGIGVNVAFSDADRYAFNPASILLETGRFIDYRDVLGDYINAYNNALEYSIEEVYNYYIEHSIVLGKTVIVDRKEVFIKDIDMTGELVVTQGKTTNKLTPNEITLKELYSEQ